MSAAGDGADRPVTPVLVKTAADLPWPEDQRTFYILGRDGLYLGRNHEFFQSCVPARRGPSELEEQVPFLASRFPKIPRALFERAVGFFDRVADLHSAEAAVMLVWDRSARCVRLVVPEQTATVSSGWSGSRYPIGVHYVPPADLPADCVPFGDIHSHVDYSAYASSTDVADEVHTAGLHIVVGRITREPPDIHVEAVVDGTRFELDVSQVIEDYRRRRMNVPEAWIERVEIKESTWGYRQSRSAS
jgi:proteasome lid subunit RPN8/RPN11